MENLSAIDFGSQLSTEVAAGGYHTCVLRQEDSNDAVTCFGSGVYGQLGDGTFLDLGDSPDEKLRSFSLRFFLFKFGRFEFSRSHHESIFSWFVRSRGEEKMWSKLIVKTHQLIILRMHSSY